MAKKTVNPTTSKAARYVKVGDVVQVSGPKRTEPVRLVRVVLSLADGTDVVMDDPDELVTIVQIPEPVQESDQ